MDKEEIKNKEIIERLSKGNWESNISIRNTHTQETYPIKSISHSIDNGVPNITIDFNPLDGE